MILREWRISDKLLVKFGAGSTSVPLYLRILVLFNKIIVQYSWKANSMLDILEQE